MAASKKDKINLLPKEEFESTTAGRVLVWLLSTFKVIVIVVELVVITAFLSRFVLDARNADLDDEIEAKQARILSKSQFEKVFRETQQKINIIKEAQTRETPSDALELVYRRLPAEVFLTSATFTNERFEVAGLSLSEQNIAQFMVNLKASGEFDVVEIRSLSESQEALGLIEFVISFKTEEAA